MENLNYPLLLKFNIATLANDFTASDASGATVAYVKQKMFKLVDEINVFSNENMQQQLFQIKANKWIDFSAAYTFTSNMGTEVGKVARKGWASIWKAHYEVVNPLGVSDYTIREENAFIKVLDGIFSEIPIIGMLTGYVFNPSYIVTNASGQTILRLKKQASFFGRTFSIEQVSEVNKKDNARLLLALMMMILLERRRG